MKCGTMKRKKNNRGLLNISVEQKNNQRAKKKNVEQKSEVTEHFVDVFFSRKIIFGFDVIGSLIRVHRKNICKLNHFWLHVWLSLYGGHD